MKFLQFLKSDYGLAFLCLVTLFGFKFLQEAGNDWAEYGIWACLVYPGFLFVSQSIYAIRRTFFGYKKDE